MSGALLTPRHAWLPVTPRGVAAFAGASLGRLLLVQLIVAVLAGALVSGFVAACWFPVVRAALAVMPDQAAIRQGSLQWPTNSPARLADNRFLALSAAPEGGLVTGPVADLGVTLRRNHLRLSLMGWFVETPYPAGYTISLDRHDALPWWGAWELPMLFVITAATAFALMSAWQFMALFYTPLAHLLAVYSNRSLGWLASWKLCGAALMPAAAVAMGGLISYGWLGADLIKVALFYLLHFVTGVVYVAASPWFLPRQLSSTANPFAPPGGNGEAKTGRGAEPQNPFAPRR